MTVPNAKGRLTPTMRETLLAGARRVKAGYEPLLFGVADTVARSLEAKGLGTREHGPKQAAGSIGTAGFPKPRFRLSEKGVTEALRLLAAEDPATALPPVSLEVLLDGIAAKLRTLADGIEKAEGKGGRNSLAGNFRRLAERIDDSMKEGSA